jgi:hypothetical protein
MTPPEKRTEHDEHRSAGNARPNGPLESQFAFDSDLKRERGKRHNHEGGDVKRCYRLRSHDLAPKLLELDPAGDDLRHAEPPHLVFFVAVEVAFKPFDVAVAFER